MEFKASLLVHLVQENLNKLQYHVVELSNIICYVEDNIQILCNEIELHQRDENMLKLGKITILDKGKKEDS